MIDIRIRELYLDYMEDVCVSDEAKANGAVVRRENNPNARVRKSWLDPRKARYAVTRKEYIDILTSINTKIAENIITKNFLFNMPFKLGGIEIVKRKPTVTVNDEGVVVNNFPIDWGATNKLWASDPTAKIKKKLIRHLNEESDGYVYHTRYNKTRAYFTNKTVYNFRISKRFKTLLFNCLKEDPTIDFYLKY